MRRQYTVRFSQLSEDISFPKCHLAYECSWKDTFTLQGTFSCCHCSCDMIKIVAVNSGEILQFTAVEDVIHLFHAFGSSMKQS